MDYDVFLRFLVALVFVLGLIGLLAWAARRFGLAGRVAARPGRRHRTLVVEATAVDAKRRRVLVRRDDVEHLVLLGPANDLVIERGIAAPVEPEAGESGLPEAGEDGGKPRDFGTELRARLGLDGSGASGAAASPPAAAFLPAERRLAGSGLARLKPKRFRLGKRPGHKR
ncbi:MAG TPA: flagellar biosynthetic protein FliO [Alphaproteobacteria bacterium]